MKRVETIIKQIDKLERELYTNYDDKTIKEAIEKCERNIRLHRFGQRCLCDRQARPGQFDSLQS